MYVDGLLQCMLVLKGQVCVVYVDGLLQWCDAAVHAEHAI